jgi:hypothetical protein
MRRTIWLALATALALMLVTAGSVAASDTEQTAVVEQGTTPRLTGYVAASQWGTAWVPERRNRFAQFSPKGWGTQVRAKAAGDEWVHLPLPLPTDLGTECLSPKYYVLTFCASSSAPSQTRPIQFDVWAVRYNAAGSTMYPAERVYSAPIAFWPAGDYCTAAGISYQVYEAMGLSVLLHFANATDRITLGMAMAMGDC